MISWNFVNFHHSDPSYLTILGGLFIIIVVVCTSFTLFYLKNKKIYTLAFHDATTLLPNANQLVITYPKFQTKTKHSGYIMVVKFEQLSTINITYGVSVSDAIIVEIAKRLSQYVNNNGLVFRIETDTFAVLLNNVKKNIDIYSFSEQLLANFKNTVFYGLNLTMYPRICIVSIDPNLSLVQAVHQCTITLAFVSTRNLPIVYYNSTIKHMMWREVCILEELQSIIAGFEPSRLYLMYQPQLQSEDKSVVSVEALARFNSKSLGAVSPSEFITIAEKHHIIYELGLVLLHSALKTAIQVNRLELGKIRFAINVSGKQLLHEKFTQDILNILALHNVEGDVLELEITESIFLHDLKKTNSVLSLLRSKGIVISIDDFGTGYSSFSSLSELSVDIVKINGMFIRQIHKGAENENAVIAREIIKMAHALKLKIVAEEIEHEDEFHYLIQQKCDYLQGYYFCRPLLPFDLIHFVQTTNV